MRMMRKTLGFFAIFLVGLHVGHAQDVKKEYEKSIKAEEIPAEVLELVSPILEEGNGIEYFEEFNGQDRSFEIKMEWRGKQISVEFYEDGRLMDIERLISFDEIGEDAKENIHEYLESYTRYKIIRLQRQYSAEDQDEEDEEVIEEFIEQDIEDLTVRYEMVVYLKGHNRYGPYELLFDHEGALINSQEVERRSPDNVLY